MPLRDADIRSALRASLNHWHRHEVGTLVRDELGLLGGRTRVDVAVVNGALTGYEIKSDIDSLQRLPGQVAIYEQVLDFASIICGPRYVDLAHAHVPAWWGLIQVRPADDASATSPHVEVLREPRPHEGVLAESVVQLLWRDEAVAELRELGHARGLSAANRWAVWDRLVEVTTLPELQSIVRRRLKTRPSW